jgi:hypothetical protein
MSKASSGQQQRLLIMVCGAARSGTTMLDLMLGNSDDTFSCGEVYAKFRPYRKHHFDPVCGCGAKDCSIWAGLKDVPEQDFHPALFAQMQVKAVIDSSKNLGWVVDSNEWAHAHNLPVANILIWKDAKDLAHSHWKRGNPISHFRGQFLKYYERFIDLELPFVAVRYSQLAENSQQTLMSICDVLGLEYKEGRELFWQQSNHQLFGSGGVQKQMNSDQGDVKAHREYPAEFEAAYAAYAAKHLPDSRVDRLIQLLEAQDIKHQTSTPAASNYVRKARPFWYRRNALMQFFKSYFPGPAPSADN